MSATAPLEKSGAVLLCGEIALDENGHAAPLAVYPDLCYPLPSDQ